MRERLGSDGTISSGVRTPAAGRDAASAVPTLDSLVRGFWLIEDALGNYRNVVRLPGRLFLEDLPLALRGPRWNPRRFPDMVIEVAPWDLWCKIRSGHIAYPLGRIADDMPAGWMKGPGDAEIVLDRNKVLAALKDWPWATSI